MYDCERECNMRICGQVWGLPRSYEDAISAAQAATRAAIADGVRLLEVEFPTAGLDSVAGDAEGQNEMTYSLEFLRRYLVVFQLQDSAGTTRVFFPDKEVCPAAHPPGCRSPCCQQPRFQADGQMNAMAAL